MPTRFEKANALRFLSIDAVERARSGHPGMPMGMADIAEVLFNDFLRHNPANPTWFNRDRFVLSNGHGSMLLYAVLHLTGYDLSLDELKAFRQLHSATPGHPEHGLTPGVETTTGPLGQGLAQAVGMALAEKILAAEFNQPGYDIVDHITYTFVGDGCMMEGISHEAASFAGTMGLGKLIALYDDNGISIDGEVKDWFGDSTAERFEAYHWHVVKGVDGHDPEAVKQAIAAAKSVTNKPSLICCKTTIGFGAPKLAGNHQTHGAPLGATEVADTRKKLNWPYAPFEIPDEIRAAWDAREQGQALESTWKEIFKRYQSAFPALAAEFTRRLNQQLPQEWNAALDQVIQNASENTKSMATRKASQAALETIGALLPEAIGGSADLTGSNLTAWSQYKPITAENFHGNYLHYGVREFGMAAMMNGMALHGGILPYGGTFLVFADYARNAIRLSALMKQRVIYVLTHDSIGLGEDGPTHQPIEHAAMLRYTPNLSVWRPCDLVETLVAWRYACEKQTGPTALLLSRQDTARQEREPAVMVNIARGGYILFENAPDPEIILIATGSEVELAVTAYENFKTTAHRIRVVSMPSCDVFDAQSQEYRDKVLPPSVSKRIAIEAAQSDYWYKYTGLAGRIIGLKRFGESAPAPAIYQALGITAIHIIDEIKSLLGVN